MMLDIGSHWLQTNSACFGSQDDNHKNLEEEFLIVDMYYKSCGVMCVICWCSEIFLVQLYYVHFNNLICKAFWFKVLLFICFFIYSLKQIISVMQIISASRRIGNNDMKKYIKN